MAVLPDADRQRVWRGFMRYLSATLDGIPVCLKADIRAAVDATDDWLNTNQASFNSALPATFRNNATLAQKALLLAAVVLMRAGVGFLRQVFGEVE